MIERRDDIELEPPPFCDFASCKQRYRSILGNDLIIARSFFSTEASEQKCDGALCFLTRNVG